MSKKSKKHTTENGGIVYSTDPNYVFADLFNNLQEEKVQNVKIWIDRKGGGKLVTRVEGLALDNDSLSNLKKDLQALCGAGGSVKDGEILIQGNHRDKVFDYLKTQNYNPKKAGG